MIKRKVLSTIFTIFLFETPVFSETEEECFKLGVTILDENKIYLDINVLEKVIKLKPKFTLLLKLDIYNDLSENIKNSKEFKDLFKE